MELVDVGGQRNERRKWINMFDNVKSVLFIVNLAGYRLVLYEEETKNRLQESLELFGETVRSPVFQDVPVFLVFNKKDLFEGCLDQTPLSVCFPDYTGDNSTQDCISFIESKFRERLPENAPELGVFTISARVKFEVRNTFRDLSKELLSMSRAKIDKEVKQVRRIMERGKSSL